MYSDLYNTSSCYSDGIMYVWGDTYYGEGETQGYLTYASVPAPTVKLPEKTAIRSLMASRKAFTVKWKKKSYTGYQIGYCLKSSMKASKTVNITKASTTSKKVRGLKKRRGYYVQVRTYKKYNGKRYYSSWSKKVSEDPIKRLSSRSSYECVNFFL